MSTGKMSLFDMLLNKSGVSTVSRIAFWLNFVLVVGLGYLTVKFLVSGIRYFTGHSKNNLQAQQIRKTLGETLKEQRIACNMTQEFVAQQLGVSRQAVSKWENGTSEPSTSNLLALANLYGVDAGRLLKSVDI